MTFLFLLFLIINKICFVQNQIPFFKRNYQFAISNKQYNEKMIVRNKILSLQLLANSNTNYIYINRFRSLQFKLNKIMSNYFKMPKDDMESIELVLGLLN